jgi:hypothetical protein
MIWQSTHGFDQRARELADRHYSRQKKGARQFVPPARRIVLVTPDYSALWVTIHQRYVKHDWPGAWFCSLFRNEGTTLSSELVRAATDETLARWGQPPAGLLTFVNVEKTAKRRSKRSAAGACFIHAGWRAIATTCDLSHRLRGSRKVVLRAPD